MSNKGVITVLGHQIEWNCIAVNVQELEERDIDQIHSMIEEGSTEGCAYIGESEAIDWKIVNPEADKWKAAAKSSIDAAEDSSRHWHLKSIECDKWMKIAEALYQAIKQYAGSTKLTQEAISNYEKARDEQQR